MNAPAGGLELRDVGPTRSGYFMQVPFLMLGGYDSQPNPVLRGSQLEAAILCGPPPTRAAGHAASASAVRMPGQTNRQRVRELTSLRQQLPPLHRSARLCVRELRRLGAKARTRQRSTHRHHRKLPLQRRRRAVRGRQRTDENHGGELQAHTCYSKQVTGYALGVTWSRATARMLE